jgi:hypothetical protein
MNQAVWASRSVLGGRVASTAVEDVALSSEPPVVLRASVRRHRSRLIRDCFGRSDRRALCKSEGGSYYLIGDGPPGGWRTRRSGFPARLLAAGFGEWNDLAKLHEVRDLLAGVLGAGRVLVGCEGFNAVGRRRPIPARRRG